MHWGGVKPRIPTPMGTDIQYLGCELPRISLPRTRANRAEMALPSLRLLALANRVVGRRPRYINSEGA
jgi:hypothetical protein